MRAIILLILFSAGAFASGKNYEIPKRSAQAYRLTKSINFDGILDEEVYRAPSISGFVQRDPAEGEAASQNTEVWINYDEEYLYVSARLHDTEPDKIDANLFRKDTWVGTDWFMFMVDSYNDKRTGFYFAINPAGSMGDGILYNDSWDDDSWDGIWEARAKVNHDCWSVEMRIPFSQLRFKESDKMVWGVNFKREIKRNKEADYYVMVPKKESGFVSHFASLEGLDGVKPKRRMEILPYLVQRAQYLKHDDNDPYYKRNIYRTTFGADLKVGIGSALTLDGTINPDFGQVEVDPAVVNLSAFETYYNEKRPFFIEGANIFDFGFGGANNNWGFNFGVPTLFYSRRIGKSPSAELPDDYDYADVPAETRILGAAKLTGRLPNNYTVGVLSAVTERTYGDISIDGKTQSLEVEPLTYYGVARGLKEFNSGKYGLGLLATAVSRDLSSEGLRDEYSENALNLGADGWFPIGEEFVVTGYAVGSYVGGSKEFMTSFQERPYRYMQMPDREYAKLDSSRTDFAGFQGRMAINKQKGNFYLNAALGVITPGFSNSDLGFQYHADKYNGHVVLGYRWFDPDGIFRRKNLYLAHFRDYDLNGLVMNNGFMSFMYFQFMNYYSIDLTLSYNFEEYSRTLTRGGVWGKNPTECGLESYIGSDSRKSVAVYVENDYYKDELKGYYFYQGVKVDWKPDSRLNISFEPSYTHQFEPRQFIDNFDDPRAVNTYGIRTVFGELDYKTIAANFRVNWTFTPTLSLQLFVQPLLSVGSYSNFKEQAKAKSWETNLYTNVSYDAENEEYTVDPDGAGPAEQLTFDNPDFNFKSLRGNLILRWEVLPGSVFYLVWAHDKTNDKYPGDMRFGRDFKDLWYARGNNIFLAKFSYWFNM
jgi:hypothetical protein